MKIFCFSLSYLMMNWVSLEFNELLWPFFNIFSHLMTKIIIKFHPCSNNISGEALVRFIVQLWVPAVWLFSSLSQRNKKFGSRHKHSNIFLMVTTMSLYDMMKIHELIINFTLLVWFVFKSCCICTCRYSQNNRKLIIVCWLNPL